MIKGYAKRKEKQKMEKAALEEKCQHCKFHPKATRPFIETYDMNIDLEAIKKLMEIAKELDLPHHNCVVCKIVKEMFKRYEGAEA